ncbi:MAG: hypothetical protein MJZ27_03675 [Bacteroidales bacterium]|nr:hypothetical protein [Bacteroidales bacterium]
MNSDRIIKILEWRPQISISSDNTYDPDDRKDLEEGMLDVFKQFCEFKKKKYNLTLSTSLDTQELEDMDMAILLCMTETAFGVKQFPADDLKKMQTFYDVADYVEKNLPEKSECSGCKKAKETEAKTQVNKTKNDGNGCLAYPIAIVVFFACDVVIFTLLKKIGVGVWSSIIGFILSFAIAVFVYNRLVDNSKKTKNQDSDDKSNSQSDARHKNGVGCSGWMIVVMVWCAAIMTVDFVATSLGASEDACVLSGLIGSTIAAIVTYKLLKRRIATNNEDIPDGAQKESDENSNNKASKAFIDIVLVAAAWLIVCLVVFSIAFDALGASKEVSASVGGCGGAIGAIWMYMFRLRRKSDDTNDRL